MANEEIQFTVVIDWDARMDREPGEIHGPNVEVVNRLQRRIENVTEADETSPVFDVHIETTASHEDAGEPGMVSITYINLVKLYCDEGTTRSDVITADALADHLNEDEYSHMEISVVKGYQPNIGGSSHLKKR